MAWNGSNSAGASVPAPKKPAKKSPGLAHGLIAGGAIVLIGIIALYFIGGEPDEQTVEKKGPTQIAEVEPEIAERSIAPVVPKKEVVVFEGKEYPMYNAKGGKAYVTGYGVRYHSTNIITSGLDKARMPWEEQQFKRYTDRTIASLLCTEPGSFFVGDMVYDKGFTRQFLASLDDPIVIEPDDDEDVRYLKEAVIETRKELKARYDAGEDVGEILTKTRDEFRELGAYKRELELQLEKVVRDKEMTEQDLDDFVAAANIMLESRGCTKLTMPEFVRRNVRMREQRLRQFLNNNNGDSER